MRLFAKNFDQISWFPTFVLTPLTYLGGVFYSVTMLPGWAHVVSQCQSDSVHGERVSLRLPRHYPTSICVWPMASWWSPPS